MKLSEDLKQDHECGDFGKALEGYSERAEVLEKDANRYRYLKARDLDAISIGGVFAGRIPDNIVLNGRDLDESVDFGIAELSMSCNHSWIEADNETVTGGFVCPKCMAIKPSADT